MRLGMVGLVLRFMAKTIERLNDSLRCDSFDSYCAIFRNHNSELLDWCYHTWGQQGIWPIPEPQEWTGSFLSLLYRAERVAVMRSVCTPPEELSELKVDMLQPDQVHKIRLNLIDGSASDGGRTEESVKKTCCPYLHTAELPSGRWERYNWMRMKSIVCKDYREVDRWLAKQAKVMGFKSNIPEEAMPNYYVIPSDVSLEYEGFGGGQASEQGDPIIDYSVNYY